MDLGILVPRLCAPALQSPSCENPCMCQVPPGLANGGAYLEDTLIEYFCTGLYNPEGEAAISPLAPDIDWSLSDADALRALTELLRRPEKLIISDKDRSGLPPTNGMRASERARSEAKRGAGIESRGLVRGACDSLLERAPGLALQAWAGDPRAGLAGFSVAPVAPAEGRPLRVLATGGSGLLGRHLRELMVPAIAPPAAACGEPSGVLVCCTLAWCWPALTGFRAPAA